MKRSFKGVLSNVTIRLRSFHGEVAYVKVSGKMNATDDLTRLRAIIDGLSGSDYRRIVVDITTLDQNDAIIISQGLREHLASVPVNVKLSVILDSNYAVAA